MPRFRPFPIAALELLLLASAWSSSAVAATSRYVFWHENVLGTSLELQVQADSIDLARSAEERVLAEIDRLAGILSGYDASSEFCRWQANPNRSQPLSDDLLNVLEACNRWQAASGGAFNPAVEPLSRLWTARSQEGRMPSADELAAACARVREAACRVDRASRTARLPADCPLSLNALAKGYIVDRACEAAMAPQSGIRGLMVNIGGEVRVCGALAASVGIADPWHDALNTPPWTRIVLENRALATSGNYHRGFAVKGSWFSHVIDPRTGMPADGIVSASVVAPSTADADALATICCVLPVEESLPLVKELPGAECLIVTRDGQIVQSEGWPGADAPSSPAVAMADPAAAPAAQRAGLSAPKSEKYELQVDFEINNPEGVRRYARPYVAIWIEDANGFPVRTLLLFVWNSGPGPRWIPDLRRWYRADQLRKLAEDTDLVDTMSRATHPPGKYQTTWDLTDDHGKAVAPGEYTLLIEAAREHGTYQVMSKKIAVGKEPFHEELKGNVEIKSATIDYRRPK